MWATLPKDLLLHLGTFVHHRDARCMQATCSNWEREWTKAGLMSPHPVVQQIELCTVGHCINRQYVSDTIEPFLVHREARGTMYHALHFMAFLVPVRALASVGRVLQLRALERHYARMEKTLVFWCNCTFHAYKVSKPEVCLLGPTPRWFVKEPICVDNMGVWWILLLFMSIPSSILLVCSVGTLGFTVITGYFLYHNCVSLIH